jgi:hypothetical protein
LRDRKRKNNNVGRKLMTYKDTKMTIITIRKAYYGTKVLHTVGISYGKENRSK